MELKFDMTAAVGQSEQGSNRTFMELKWEHVAAVNARMSGSNRTFMELKYESEPQDEHTHTF